MVLLENKMFLEIDPPTVMSEIIEWFDPAEQMPDSDTTVLLIISGDPETSLGYHDGTTWLEALGVMDGFPIMDDVLFWAHLPEGPAA